MKRNIILFTIMAFVAVCLASCSLEADNVDGDGDFEGFWHLESIETLAADSTSSATTQDLSHQRFFWSFQHKLLQLKDFDGPNKTYLCRFEIAGGKFTVTQAYYSSNGDDVPIENDSVLAAYGIPGLNKQFDYSIDGGKMTLTSGNTRLRLKKF